LAVASVTNMRRAGVEFSQSLLVGLLVANHERLRGRPIHVERFG
jgi:hypothetical protein